MTQHTPGPWGIAPNRRQVLAPHVIQRDNVLVRKLSGATPEQVEANARLIAAAPTQHESLRELVDYLDWLVDRGLLDKIQLSEPVVARARAAIAKAEEAH